MNLKQFATLRLYSQCVGAQGLEVGGGVGGWRTWNKGGRNAMRDRSREEKRLDFQGYGKFEKK